MGLAKADGRESDGNKISGSDWCKEFEKELWFDMGNSMWRENCYVFQDHVKYIYNDILNPYRVVIIQCAKRVPGMHDIIKFMYPTSKKGDEYDMEDWNACDKDLS